SPGSRHSWLVGRRRLAVSRPSLAGVERSLAYFSTPAGRPLGPTAVPDGEGGATAARAPNTVEGSEYRRTGVEPSARRGAKVFSREIAPHALSPAGPRLDPVGARRRRRQGTGGGR